MTTAIATPDPSDRIKNTADEVHEALDRIELKLEVALVDSQMRLAGKKNPTASEVLRIALDNMASRN